MERKKQAKILKPMKKIAIDIRRRLNSGVGRVVQWLVDNITDDILEDTTLSYIATETSWKDYLPTKENCIIATSQPFSKEEIKEIPEILQQNDIALWINPQINISPYTTTPTITIVHDTWYLFHKELLPTINDVKYRFRLHATDHFAAVANILTDNSAKKLLTQKGYRLWKESNQKEILNRYGWSLFSLITEKSNELVFVSEQVEKNYLSLFKPRKNINIIENDVAFQCHISDTVQKKIFLSLAKLEKRKNILFILDSYERYVKKTEKKAHPLVIVGDRGYGSYSEKVLAKISKLQNEGFDVSYAGALNDSELARYFNKTVALISASQTESFGLPVLESISHGIPTFSARTGKIVDWFGEDDKLFFDNDDYESLANLLIAITDKPLPFQNHFSVLRQELLEKRSTKSILDAWITLIHKYL